MPDRLHPRLARALTVVAVWALAACEQPGRYELFWRFADQPAGQPFTARECGLHGVDALGVTGIGGDGNDAHAAIYPCGPGRGVAEVPPGTWTLRIDALGTDGAPREADLSSDILRVRVEGVVVNEDRTTAVPIELPPQPQCRDGVDNDLDGAIDLDDRQCGGDPEAGPE